MNRATRLFILLFLIGCFASISAQRAFGAENIHSDETPVRSEPGENLGDLVDGLRVGLRLPKLEFAPNDEITAVVSIRNESPMPRTYAVLTPDKNSVIKIATEHGNLVPMFRATNLFGDRVVGMKRYSLRPGFQREYEIRLDNKFDLREPGTYSVSAGRILLLPEDPPLAIEAMSSNVTIRIAAKTSFYNLQPEPSAPSAIGSSSRFPIRPKTEVATGTLPASATSSVVAESRNRTAPPLASTSPVRDAHSDNSDQKTGVGIIVGLLALLFAILWRAARRKRQA